MKPNGDQRLISPYINTSETFIRSMRINEMIANLRCFDCEKKIILVSAKGNVEKIMENMGTDVRVDEVQC